MSKRNRQRSAQAPVPQGPAPQLLGPPAPIQPPPDGLVLRLGAEPDTLVLSIPGGREYSLRAGAETLGQIIGILERLQGRAKPISPASQPSGLYQRGQALDFIPRGEAWREADFWPRANGRALDRCPVEVVAHRVGGTVLCTAPDGKTYGLPEKYLSPRGGLKPKSQSNVLTLEDLGL